MKKEKKIIMFDSPEAAVFRTDLKGWVSSNGGYYGNDENLARFVGSTHKKCGCGDVMEKGYTICNRCIEKKHTERFFAMPEKEWDGITPISNFDGEEFFYDISEIEDFCDNYDMKMEDLRLTHTIPNRPRCVDMDLWGDEVPSEIDDIAECFTKEAMEAIDNLNKILQDHKPLSYSPCNIRVKL